MPWSTQAQQLERPAAGLSASLWADRDRRRLRCCPESNWAAGTEVAESTDHLSANRRAIPNARRVRQRGASVEGRYLQNSNAREPLQPLRLSRLQLFYWQLRHLPAT